MKITRFVPGVAGLLFFAGMLPAEVFPGRWQKLEAEGSGTQVIVELKSGDKITGAFQECTAEALNVLEINGRVRTLRKEDVARVLSGEKRSGSLRNGALIGFFSGFIPVLGIGLAAGVEPGPVVMAGALWGGIGAGVGAGIDAAVKGHEVLYKAPKPRK